CFRHHLSDGNNRDIPTLAFDVSNTDRDGIFLLRDRAFGARGQYLIFKDHHGVIVPNSTFHQALGIIRRGRHYEFQAGQVHEHWMGALRMLRGGGATTARRGTEDDGERCLASEHVVDLRHLVDNLVHGGEGKRHHSRADNGPEPTAGGPDTGTHIGVL